MTGKCETIGTDPEEPDGIGSLDGDTALSHGSFLAAMHAAGSVCEAVDMVVKKEVIPGISSCRADVMSCDVTRCAVTYHNVM